MNDILTILWIFAPIGFANTGPVTASKLPFLRRYNQPLDFGKTYRGKRIFGDHKTIRGIIAGGVVGLLTAGLQILLSAVFSWPESYSMGLDYGSTMILVMGLFMGFGALIGDAVKSFFKRQMNIAPGRSWVPFDQLDFVIGGAIASLPFIVLPFYMYVLTLFVALIIHPTFNVLAWILRLQDKPF